MTQQADATGCYVYGIVRASTQAAPTEQQLPAAGMHGRPVYLIRSGSVAAVVSDAPNTNIRPSRRELSTHHHVTMEVTKVAGVLPMQFGVIADDGEEVGQILERNEAFLREQLDRVDGKVEMGLRIDWDVPNIFEYFVDVHPGLGAARDRLFANGRTPTTEEKMNLGRQFERLLKDDRAAHTGRARAVLEPVCAEITEGRLRNEQEVANLACLIRREDEGAFENQLFEAAKCFDEHFKFDYNGPWPPHSFVDVQLQR